MLLIKCQWSYCPVWPSLALILLSCYCTVSPYFSKLQGPGVDLLTSLQLRRLAATGVVSPVGGDDPHAFEGDELDRQLLSLEQLHLLFRAADEAGLVLNSVLHVVVI